MSRMDNMSVFLSRSETLAAKGEHPVGGRLRPAIPLDRIIPRLRSSSCDHADLAFDKTKLLSGDWVSFSSDSMSQELYNGGIWVEFMQWYDAHHERYKLQTASQDLCDQYFLDHLGKKDKKKADRIAAFFASHGEEAAKIQLDLSYVCARGKFTNF